MKITSGKIESAQKIVIYGPEGIGKSTFASKFPNPLFIDTEGSTKHIDVRRLPNPSSWAMLLESVKYVKSNPHVCDTLIIDTADWAERICIEHICSKAKVDGIEGLGYGKGYVYLAEEMGRLLNLLNEIIDIGINVVFTAHAQMRKFEQPDEIGSYDRWELKLQKKTAPLLKEWADMVLFANYKTYVVNVDGQGADKGTNKAQGGKRVMHTTHHPCWDAKNRHNLKEELPFDYREIAHCIPTKSSAVNKQKDSPVKTEAIIEAALNVFQSTMVPGEQETIEVTAQAPAKPEVSRYWHHPESSCVYITKSEKEAERIVGSDGLSVEIDKKEYDRLYKLYSSPKDDLPGVPKALADLMRQNGVTVAEIQQAVAGRGYYPSDTPIANYEPSFITGVLVAAWPQVYGSIQKNRKQGE